MHTLPKIITSSKKRIGRGYGSGKGGHTSSRGTKGQKARGSVNILFEGVKMKKSLLRRIPLLRGKEKFKSRFHPIVLKVSELSKFADGEKVTGESLVKKGLIKKSEFEIYGVKFVDGGEVTKKIIISGIEATPKAAEKIGAAGGTIEL